MSDKILKIFQEKHDLFALEGLNINFEDIKNDFYDYSKVIVKKPWGYEYLIFSNSEVAVWILYLKYGAQTSMHCHPSKKTSLVVLEGKVHCSTLIGIQERSAGEGLLIDKGVFHQTKAVSGAGAFVMEIETPINKRDLIRLKDLYGREGKGYETEEQHSFNLRNYNYFSFQGGLKKRFGHCSITFKKIKDSSDFEEILKLNSEDVISLIYGEVLNTSKQSILQIGDAVSIEKFYQSKPVEISSNSEILIIRKIDVISKVSDIVAKFLNEKNIKPVFVVAGEANVHLLDSIGKCDGLSYVCSQNEKSASLAVESFCKLKSDIGVLVISSGASSINSLAGVANAWVDSIPMLVISGQARTDQDSQTSVRQLGSKSIDTVDLVKSITKYAYKVTDPASVLYHLEKAVHIAAEGRQGPVWIDLPIDVQGISVDESSLVRFESISELKGKREKQFISQELSKVIDLLKGSSRPVILAGSGIRHAKSTEDFLRLINKLKIPVLTSRRGIDIVPDENSYFFGRPGTYGQRSANFIIQNCDLLISIGSRLSIPLIGRNTEAFARAAYKIVVDIDIHELKKQTLKIDLPIVSDAGEFIRQFEHFLPDNIPSYYDWYKRCLEWRKRFPIEMLHPFSVVRELSDEMDVGDVLVVDGGASLIYAMQAFNLKEGQRLISSTGLELPGFAIAGSIGVCVARGKKQIVCLCEDRCLQNSLQDLQTIIDYRLPIKILVLQSRGHSMIRNIQRDFFGGRFVGTDQEIYLETPSFSRLATIFGFGVTNSIQELLKISGPAIYEIKLEDVQDRIPRPGFIMRDDQKWEMRPLEDMVPFLDRKTFQENMMIDLAKESI